MSEVKDLIMPPLERVLATLTDIDDQLNSIAKASERTFEKLEAMTIRTITLIEIAVRPYANDQLS
jgi:hypothetical protein